MSRTTPRREGAAPFGIRCAYALGQSSQSAVFDGALLYVFFFYTAVLGLPGALAGLALGVSLCLDAVIDPLVGSASDALRSRWGRRVPFMAVGAPLIAVTVAFLFAPPRGLHPAVLFVWLLSGAICARAAVSLFYVPYTALGAEMSDDPTERTRIVAYRSVVLVAGGVALTAAAYTVFFTGRLGLQRFAAYAPFGLAVGLSTSLACALCVIGTARYSAALRQPARGEGAGPGEGLLNGLREIAANPSFRSLFPSAFVFYAAAGLNAQLQTHAYVFAWGLRTSGLQAISYAYLLAILAGVAATPVLAARLERKTLVIGGFLLVEIAWAGLPGLRALGVVRPGPNAAAALLAANAALSGLGVGALVVAYPAMMADAADEHEHLFASRREGLYFAGLSFAGKAASGLGAFFAGLALSAIGFPATPPPPGARLAEGLLGRLAGVEGPAAAALGLIALVFILPYGLDRRRCAEIRAALDGARAGATPAPAPGGSVQPEALVPGVTTL